MRILPPKFRDKKCLSESRHVGAEMELGLQRVCLV